MKLQLISWQIFIFRVNQDSMSDIYLNEYIIDDLCFCWPGNEAANEAFKYN